MIWIVFTALCFKPYKIQRPTLMGFLSSKAIMQHLTANETWGAIRMLQSGSIQTNIARQFNIQSVISFFFLYKFFFFIPIQAYVAWRKRMRPKVTSGKRRQHLVCCTYDPANQQSQKSFSKFDSISVECFRTKSLIFISVLISSAF